MKGDGALMRSVSRGDEDAAATFVRRHRAEVFALALTITHDRGLAEDVSQDAFTRAWRAAGRYDARKGSVSAWLLTITRHAAIDTVRVRRPLTATEEMLEGLLLADTTVTGDEALWVRLESNEVLAQLPALPAEQARAVVLAVVAGCSASEISAREEIPLGTAKTRLRSGLAKLRTAVARESY